MKMDLSRPAAEMYWLILSYGHIFKNKHELHELARINSWNQIAQTLLTAEIREN